MIFIILAMLLYTAAILLGATASRHLNTNLASAITNVMSASIPVVVAAHLFTKQTLHNYKFGILMAALGGVMVGLFVMSLNKSFSVAKIGIVTPVVFGGAIFLSTILSYFIFKEKISTLQAVGLAFLAVGFILIIYAKAVAD